VGGGGSNSQKLGVGVVADQLGGVTSSVVDYVNPHLDLRSCISKWSGLGTDGCCRYVV